MGSRRVFASAEGQTHVLIGKDTRVSGYMFESALEAGLVAAGPVSPAGTHAHARGGHADSQSKASAGIYQCLSQRLYG